MTFAPLVPWQAVAVLVAAALGVILWARLTGRLRGPGRGAIVALHAVTGLLLLLAALNPIRRIDAEASRSHLVLALDVSRSVQRAGRDWPDARSTLVEALDDALAGLAPGVVRHSTASLVTFARGVRVAARELPLTELRRAVSRLSEDELPRADASDLEAGLRAAIPLLEKASRGAVLLVTDGHETRGDVRAATADLARRGVPIHVLALGGRAPEMGLYAADLPRRIEADNPSWARLMVVNGSRRELPVDLGFRLAGGEPVSRRRSLPEQAWIHVRQPVTFSDPGLNYLDLELTTGDGQRQGRRLFTYVSRPPRLLVVGDDHRWTRALSRQRFQLVMASPEALGTGFDPADYDAVILHETWADRLAPGHLERLAEAVRSDALGVFLINGPQYGGPEASTMLMSYDGTALEELSPLINRPRPVLKEPPPRQIVVLVDTSGSMSGWPLEKSKQIAAALVDRLRAIDRLHLIAFTGGAHPLLSDLPMTAEGKSQARQVLSSLRSGGGTDPTAALALIAGRRLRDCGLFVISDGEFGAVHTRPDCEATAFAIGKSAGNVSAALAEIAEPFPVPDDSFDPSAIRISFFDPKPRDNRFEAGGYTPIVGIDAFVEGWSLLPEPAPRLFGNAVTHARDDAELVAMRPRPRDPVLAYRDAEKGGTVGAFTTRLPPGYYDSAAGAEAITRWIERLLAHSERDRYGFHLEDRGEAIDLRLTLLSRDGILPRVDRLSVSLEVAGAASRPVALAPDPELAGVFSGVIQRPAARQEGEAQARLVVSESGRDAPRRPQRISLRLPPRGDFGRIVGDEAWSFGLDEPLLREIASRSGGRCLEPGGGERLLHGSGELSHASPIWPGVLSAALLVFLAQVAVRRAWS